MHKEDHTNDDQIYERLADEVDKYAKMMGWVRGYGHPYLSAMNPAESHAKIEYENALKRLNAYVKGIKEPQDSDLLFENTKDSDTIVPSVLEINDELKRYLAKHPEGLYVISPHNLKC